MSKLFISVFLLALCLSSLRAAAFVPNNSVTAFGRQLEQSRTSHQSMNMLPDADSFLSSSSNMLLSTIDSDIANIPQNEFAPVFMGGIIVMFGGVLSALIVGFILERGNLYANVVADSYAQSSEDEEFWKGLSDEEKKKAQDMIDKLNAKKAQEEGIAAPQVQASSSTSNVSSVTEVVVEESKDKTTQELDMFSDYADAGKK